MLAFNCIPAQSNEKVFLKFCQQRSDLARTIFFSPCEVTLQLSFKFQLFHFPSSQLVANLSAAINLKYDSCSLVGCCCCHWHLALAIFLVPVEMKLKLREPRFEKKSFLEKCEVSHWIILTLLRNERSFSCYKMLLINDITVFLYLWLVLLAMGMIIRIRSCPYKPEDPHFRSEDFFKRMSSQFSSHSILLPRNRGPKDHFNFFTEQACDRDIPRWPR